LRSSVRKEVKPVDQKPSAVIPPRKESSRRFEDRRLKRAREQLVTGWLRSLSGR
jgi:hypothetical protein